MPSKTRQVIRSLGLHSPILDAAKRLRERDGRQKAKRYLAEGPTLLRDALAAGRTPLAIYATASALDDLGPDRDATLEGIDVYEVPERAIAKLSELENPPGIVTELPLRLSTVDALLAEADGAPVAILAGVGDPGNAGTLLRSAEIFGIAQVLVATGGVEPYNPKVVRAAMGAHSRLGIGVAAGEEIARAVTAAGYTLVVSDRDGEPVSGFAWPERVALAIGSERHGPGAALPTWERSVAIPHVGAGESLNAAVAGSILFYALAERRSGTPAPPASPPRRTKRAANP